MTPKLWFERGDQTLLQVLAASQNARTLSMRRAVMCVIIGGAVYGACMGTYGLDGARWPQIFWSALKIPLLLSLSGALSLPIFIVLYALAGLRDDFSVVLLRALLRTQAVLAIVLASLSPLIVLIYASLGTGSGQLRLGTWVAIFCCSASRVAWRRQFCAASCRELWRSDARHRMLLSSWMWLVGFIGVQMAWVLRPFVGDPHSATAFFRPDALSNAYIALWSWIF